MRSKTIIIGIVIVLLIVGAGAPYLLTRDEGSTSTPANNSTNNTDNSSQKEAGIRKKVWDQLPSEQQEQIDWTEGEVSKIVYKKGMGTVDDPSYEGKEVYVIDFTRDIKAIPNNIVIYANVTTGKRIGSGFVD